MIFLKKKRASMRKTEKWGSCDAFNDKYAYPKGKKGYSEPEEGQNALGNLILSQNTRLNLNIKETFKNDNVFVLGSTGTGKTRCYIKPNLLQMNTSYVVTDPAGELLLDTKDALEKSGYVVKVLNLAEMEHSCGYNPFEYITSDSDIPILIDCLIKNTQDNKDGKGDPFFEQAMKQLFTAVFYYVYYRMEKDKQNMGTVCDLLAMMAVNEDKPDAKSKLDLMFDEYERDDPQATAVTNYRMFHIGAGKTQKSIIISANVRMRPFAIESVRNLTAKDTIHLDELGDYKQAVFIVMPTMVTTYNVLAAMIYTQMFMLMYNKGYNVYKNCYTLCWDASCPIRSETYNSSEEKNRVEKVFMERIAKYRNAAISKEHIEETGETRYLIKDPNGNILTIGAENGRPAIFSCKEQAEYFMRCVKNGDVVSGKRKMPSHVHMIMDEMGSIGVIPAFDQIIATMHAFGISCSIIVQARAQLKALYGDDADRLISNCATKLFLGTVSYEDAEWMSRKLGRTSKIQVIRAARVRPLKIVPGIGNVVQMSSEEDLLMTPDEVLRKPNDHCIINVEGCSPMYDNKFKLETHQKFCELREVKRLAQNKQ